MKLKHGIITLFRLDLRHVKIHVKVMQLQKFTKQEHKSFYRCEYHVQVLVIKSKIIIGFRVSQPIQVLLSILRGN